MAKIAAAALPRQEGELNKYEGVYWLSDGIAEPEVGKAWETVKGEIVKLGGTIQGEKPGGRRPFARPMGNRQGGYYYEIAFDLDPQKVDVLQKRHKLDENVFRVVIVTARKRAAAAPAAGVSPASTGIRA